MALTDAEKAEELLNQDIPTSVKYQPEKLKAVISVVPPLSVYVLYMLGLAIECDNEAEEREMWGDEVVDWLKAAHLSPEWLRFIESLPPAPPV